MNITEHLRQFVSSECARDKRMPLAAEVGFVRRPDPSEIILYVRAEKTGKHSLSADVIHERAIMALSTDGVIGLIGRKVTGATFEHKAYWYSQVWC